MNDPANAPDWDGQQECPECGDICRNVVKEYERIIDCLDHIEDGDLRKHIRTEWADMTRLHNDRVCELNKRVVELEAKAREMKSRITFKEDLLSEARLGLIKLCEHIGRES